METPKVKPVKAGWWNAFRPWTLHGAVVPVLIGGFIAVLHSLDVKRWHSKGYDDVIFVRYSMAAAYLPESLCGKAYEIIEKILPVPDVKVFVDIDAKVAMERILARGEELESVSRRRTGSSPLPAPA